MEEVPLLKALNEKYGRQAVLIGISVDINLARADQTIKAKGMTWPQLADGKGFDGSVPTAYRINGTPTLFVIDPEGKIAAKPNSAKSLEPALQEVLARPRPAALQ